MMLVEQISASGHGFPQSISPTGSSSGQQLISATACGTSAMFIPSADEAAMAAIAVPTLAGARTTPSKENSKRKRRRARTATIFKLLHAASYLGSTHFQYTRDTVARSATGHYFLKKGVDLPTVGSPTSIFVPSNRKNHMYKFQIQDMTCGHCVASVEKAIKGVDPNASAQIDLGSKTASVVSSVPADVIEKAIAEAGYGASLAKSCCR